MELCDLRPSCGQQLDRERWRVRADVGASGSLCAVYEEVSGGQFRVDLRGPVQVRTLAGERLGLAVGSAGDTAEATFAVAGLRDLDRALSEARTLVRSLAEGSLSLDAVSDARRFKRPGRPPARTRG